MLEFGAQAGIRERIIIDVMLRYTYEHKDSPIFGLSDVKCRVNLFEQDIEVAIRDLKAMGVIEVAPGYSQTSDPRYQFTKDYMLAGSPQKISTAWIPGQGYWQQRCAGHRKGTVMCYGGHPNLHGKHYKMT